jgi:hypothetical protein
VDRVLRCNDCSSQVARLPPFSAKSRGGTSHWRAGARGARAIVETIGSTHHVLEGGFGFMSRFLMSASDRGVVLEGSEATRMAIVQLDYAGTGVHNGGYGRLARTRIPFSDDSGISSVNCRILGRINGKIGSGRSEGIVSGGTGAEIAGAFLVASFKMKFEGVPSLSRGGQDSPGLDIVLEKFGFFKGDEEKVHDRFVT